MALYRYLKAPAQIPYEPSIVVPLPRRFELHRLIPLLLMALGSFLVLGVVSPIIYHLLVVSPQLTRAQILSPLPTSLEESRSLAQVAGTTTAMPETGTPQTQATASQTDYTKASNWFPTAPIGKPNPSKITHYTINIPKINIKNAVVSIGGDDLMQSLIQYPETANPGEFGSPVIFGHSILRQFYNPSESNPNRYISMFSTIMTLEEGDKIFVNFDGIEYTYQVSDKYEVKPEQVEVLGQRFDRQSLKLITCVPEGTYLRRGVIEAQLVQS
ncbi:MAG: sortase [Candidatus Chisholmbacteria bacterium]|nr:sortase [Candidatus Chisholmbacteria bacterium]